MQQPIYWPDKNPSNTRTYQKAYDSLQLKTSQGGHPKDDMDEIFGKGCHYICNVSIAYLACRYNFLQKEVINYISLLTHCIDDRVNDYQHYAVDAVKSCGQYSNMGAQVPCDTCIYIALTSHTKGKFQWMLD